MRRGFARRIEEEAAMAIGEADGLRWSGGTCATSPPSPSTRPAPTISTTPCRLREPSAGATLDPHRRCRRPHSVRRRAREGGLPAGELDLRSRAGRADAPARALERGVQPRSGGRPARRHRRDRASESGRAALGKLLPQSDPLDARLNYDQLDEIFAGKAKTPEPVAEPLVLARGGGLARCPPPARIARGRELRAGVQLRGRPGSRGALRSADRGHKLIEYLMILTNERVAGSSSAGGS